MGILNFLRNDRQERLLKVVLQSQSFLLERTKSMSRTLDEILANIPNLHLGGATPAEISVAVDAAKAEIAVELSAIKEELGKDTADIAKVTAILDGILPAATPAPAPVDAPADSTPAA